MNLSMRGSGRGAGPGCRDGRILDTYASKVSKNVSKLWPKSVQTQMCPKIWPKCDQKVSKPQRCPKLWPKKWPNLFSRRQICPKMWPLSVQKCDQNVSKNVSKIVNKKCPIPGCVQKRDQNLSKSPNWNQYLDTFWTLLWSHWKH